MSIKTAVIACLILLLLAFTANAKAEGWTGTDKALGVAAMTLHVIDWRQTTMIARNPDVYYEKNYLLGEHPSISSVNRHFLVSGLIIAGLAHFIPEYRTEILSVYVAVQTVNTVKNYQLGLRVRF